MVRCLDGNGQITPAVFSWRKRREFCGSSSYSVSVGLALINGGWGACYLAQFTLEMSFHWKIRGVQVYRVHIRKKPAWVKWVVFRRCGWCKYVGDFPTL